MTTRNVGGQYTLSYNAENKLAEAQLNGVTQATYTYDGDGTLVKKVVGGQTTIYVGNHFEKNLSTGEVTKYYTLGDRRVAMRKLKWVYPHGMNDLAYLHGDHLGSASMTTDDIGGVQDAMRYYPYGGTRSGTMATDRRFTGQREETAIGLYDYKARYYDPVLGRFIQADTIVPEPGNPQALNRYAYVVNSPLRLVDPSGHAFRPPNLTFKTTRWANWQIKTAQGLTIIGGGQAELRGDRLIVAPSTIFVPAPMAVTGTPVSATGNKAIQAAGAATAAATADGDPTNEIQAGMAALKRLAHHPKIFHPFRLGYQAQLERAQHWLSQKQLTGVEVSVPGGRVDITLTGNRAVEVKYWTQTHLSANLEKLSQQLLRYQNSDYQMVLELVQTKTDPIAPEYFLNKVLPYLTEHGVRLMEGSGVIK